MDHIAEIRSFNRFYTRIIGVLDEGLTHTTFSLAEARVIYELATRGHAAAADLARSMSVDAAYTHRLVQRLIAADLVAMTPATDDKRRNVLTLTPAGNAAFEKLSAAANDSVATMLASIEPARRDGLVTAMARIRTTLGDTVAPAPLVIRPPRAGDVAYAVARQTALYVEEYGWDGTYEPLAMEIGAKFLKDFDPARECCFIAERGSETVGAVFLVNAGEGIGQLRLLYVEPSARGLGIGKALVGECVRFAKAKGYARMRLWTQSILTSARKIYAAHGFAIVEFKPARVFGQDLVGEYWEKPL